MCPTEPDPPPTTWVGPGATRAPRLLTRRRLLAGASVLAGLGVVGGVAVAAGITTPSRRGAMVEAPVDEADLTRWRADLDTLAAHDQSLVRTGVYPWLVAPNPQQWDAGAADFYHRALDEARHRDLEINLVVPGAPDWAASYDFERYLAACTWFWTSMADTFDGQVALWQAFNEADHSHYQRFTPVPADGSTVDPGYLAELARLLGTARSTLGRHGTPITTNLTGWPLDDAREQGWYQVLDALGEAVDIISLDLYPADDEVEIDRLAARIERVHQRYGRPVYVAEIGLQTTEDSWSEEEQHRFLPAAVHRVREVGTWGVCLYQLRDQPSPAGFGIIRADGSRKPAFDDVLHALE